MKVEGNPEVEAKVDNSPPKVEEKKAAADPVVPSQTLYVRNLNEKIKVPGNDRAD